MSDNNPALFEEGTRYQVGGTIQPGAGIFYIPRNADNELLELCREGTFVYVLTSRQMGKSSLKARTTKILKAERIQTVSIELDEIGTSVTQEQWYNAIVVEINQQLELNFNALAWWEENNHLGHTKRLVTLLQHILQQYITRESIVIFVDEIDMTLSLPFASDFFAAIRSLYNSRSETEAFKRLSFVLIGVATPNDLISDKRRTPFNIGEQVDLTDFTRQEAIPLSKGLELDEPKAEKVLGWIMDWTNGHPYLTQLVCKLVSAEGKKEWTKNDIDLLVSDTFFVDRNDIDVNIQFVASMLTVNTPKNKYTQVREAYKSIIHGEGKIREQRQSVVHSHLKLSGIVKTKGPYLVIRNKIYKEIFDGQWLESNAKLSWVQRYENVIKYSLLPLLLLFGVTLFSVFFLLSSNQQISQQKDEITHQNNEISQQNDLINIARNNALEKEAEAIANAHQAQQERANAIEQERIAVASADQAKQERANALEQKLIAEKNAAEADSLRQIAQDRAKALEEERQKTLSVALAAQSIRAIANNQHELAAQLSIQAYVFNQIEGKDGPYRNEVFNAMQESLRELNSDSYPAIVSQSDTPYEIHDVVYSPISPAALYSDNANRINLLDRIASREKDSLRILLKLSTPATSLTISPNGKHLVALVDSLGGYTFTMKIDGNWGPPSRITIRDTLTAAAFMPNNTDIAVAINNSVYLYDTKEDEIQDSLKTPTSLLCNELTALAAYSKDKLIGGCRNGNLIQWHNVGAHDSLEALFTSEHRKHIRSLAISNSGNMLAVGADSVASNDEDSERKYAIWIWDLQSERASSILTFIGHEGPINTLSFKDEQLASGSADGDIRLWTVDTRESLQDVRPRGGSVVLKGHERWVRGVSFHPARDELISASADGTVRKWDLRLHALAQKLCAEVSTPLNDAQWNSFVGQDVTRRQSCAEISQIKP